MGMSINNPQRGFTLVEMIMAIVILLVLGSVASYVIVEATGVYARTAPAMEATHAAQSALERIRREIREIRTATATDIPTFTATSVSFTKNDGTSASFSLSGTDLLLGTDKLAEGVTSLTFTYLKADGTAASTADEINLIEADLTATRGIEVYREIAVIFPRYFG